MRSQKGLVGGGGGCRVLQSITTGKGRVSDHETAVAEQEATNKGSKATALARFYRVSSRNQESGIRWY